ncbi:MAG TPA: polymer-forming cytoskeletal protein [Terriglobales bacterium]
MNPFLSVTVLFVLTGFFLVVPIIPAIRELYRKSDAQPLLVIQKHAGEIRHFSEGFRSYVEQIKPVFEQCLSSGTTARGTLKDKAEYFVMGDSAVASIREVRKQDGECNTVVVACADLHAPGVSNFSREIYIRGKFQGGDYNHYRAILGDKDVQLGAHSIVMRWVHSVGAFSAGHDCDLNCRISSDSSIKLGTRCSFLRLNAPRIELGTVVADQNPAPQNGMATPAVPKRYLYDEDFEIPAGEIFHGNVVTRGKLIARKGSQIFGSIKSNKQMVLEDRVLVTGSVISSEHLEIGTNCSVGGPVIAEREMSIEPGVRIGTTTRQTTVSSPKIVSKENVVICGTLWAREHGEVARHG